MAGQENEDEYKHTDKQKRVEHSVRQAHGPHVTVVGSGIIHSKPNFITLRRSLCPPVRRFQIMHIKQRLRHGCCMRVRVRVRAYVYTTCVRTRVHVGGI